jgi:hypothetical protein
VILILVAFLGLWVFVELGSLPGKKAAERQHPQADAINVLGWLGLIAGGVGWIVAMVWAHMKPPFEPLTKGQAAGEAAAAPDRPAEDAT